MASETRFVPMGGETCTHNPPRSSCATAQAELAQYHSPYLNRDYHPTVLAEWQSDNCLPTTEDFQEPLAISQNVLTLAFS